MKLRQLFDNVASAAIGRAIGREVSRDAAKVAEDAAKAVAKQALLDKLGITAEEAALLLGGN